MQKKGPNCQRNGGLSQWKCGFDQSQLRSLSWRFFANSHVTQSKIMFSLVIETFDASCKWRHIMYCIRMLSSPDKHNLARYPDRQKDNLTKHNTHDISVHRRFFLPGGSMDLNRDSLFRHGSNVDAKHSSNVYHAFTCTWSLDVT